MPASCSTRSTFPPTSRCSCPTNSSKVFGRMRSANGWTGVAWGDEFNSNRSMISCYHIKTARVQQAQGLYVGGFEVVTHGGKIGQRQATFNAKHPEDCAFS